ncbi:hypothetical protein [Halodesulfovibrio sp.]|uniref:hypothetical protein n=1 Tax=Halodesulfovibrio sp. TaxID=1912772 RepID=UPI0025BDB885|nr:hypothetical protein [Halodesulfovibrio sp.]
MQINSSNNSILDKQLVLKTQTSPKATQAKSDSQKINKTTIDSAAQNILEKTIETKNSPVYLENTQASKGTAFTEEIVSIINERVQAVATLVAEGVDKTAAKYAVAGDSARKGAIAMNNFKSENDSEVLEKSTEETKEEKEQQETENSEEIVEEEIEVTKTDPSSGERVKEVKVVRKVRAAAKSTSTADIDTKVQPVKAVKGQKVNIKV